MPGYDYSQCGAYFVTICARRDGAAPAFADADIPDVQERFPLTDIGKIIDRNWLDLCCRFPQISLDEYVIMPNHLHGIVVIHGTTTRAAPALGAVIGAFKSKSVTDVLAHIAANRLEMAGKIWQRNYFERIIRSEKELDAVRAYIRNNPQKWAEDRDFNPRVGAALAAALCPIESK